MGLHLGSADEKVEACPLEVQNGPPSGNIQTDQALLYREDQTEHGQVKDRA